ncbi:MAG: hypothetical protein OXT70_01075 [Chloroflexota bacterium]|nr:hypothetical protein [Chloroflexota bacterium]
MIEYSLKTRQSIAVAQAEFGQECAEELAALPAAEIVERLSEFVSTLRPGHVLSHFGKAHLARGLEIIGKRLDAEAPSPLALEVDCD